MSTKRTKQTYRASNPKLQQKEQASARASHFSIALLYASLWSTFSKNGIKSRIVINEKKIIISAAVKSSPAKY